MSNTPNTPVPQSTAPRVIHPHEIAPAPTGELATPPTTAAAKSWFAAIAKLPPNAGIL